MDTSEYYLELPKLSYDANSLLKITNHKSLQWKLYWLSEWGNHEDYKENYKNYDIDIKNYMDYPDINVIVKQLPKSVQFDEMCKFKKFPKEFVHGLHKDNSESSWKSKRKAFIHIPITKNASAINFHDNEKQFVCKLHYQVPTLVNTQQYHIIDAPTSERISLQITMPHHFEWAEIKDIILQHL